MSPAGNDPDLPRGLSVVVPVYNSEANLRNLCSELAHALAQQTLPFEIILVNDGSLDGSWATIADCAREDASIQGINLLRNFGQHNALLCGIRAARFDTVVTLDDDLQHPPAEISRLLAKLAEGYDVVYGSPQRERHNLWREGASRITKLVLQKAMGASTARNISAFRAFRTITRSAFVAFDGPHANIDVLLTWGARRFTAIEVRHEPRRQGHSNYTFRKLVTHTINMVTGFSIAPLQLASLLGFACAALGLLVLGYVLVRYLVQGAVVPGFAFLASIIAIFSGVQLFALGIIGEYLARMHFRTMNRPTYVVGGTTLRGAPPA